MTTNRLTHTPSRLRATVVERERMVLSIWEPDNNPLRYNQVVDALAAKGLSPSTSKKYIRRMVESGQIIKREQEGVTLYLKVEAPKEFDTLTYMSALNTRMRSHGMVNDWDVSGLFSHLAQGLLIGFPTPETIELSQDERKVMSVLSLRLAWLFAALVSLRNDVLYRHLGYSRRLSDLTLREYAIEAYAKMLEDSHDDTEEVAARLVYRLGKQEDVVRILKRNRFGRELPHSEGSVSMYWREETLDVAAKLMEEVGREIDMKTITIPEIMKRLRYIEKRERACDRRTMARNKDKLGMIMLEYPEGLKKEGELWRKALSIKLAEALSSMGVLETNEMAIVVTAHPRTMNQTFDDEKLVHEIIMEVVEEFKEEGKPTDSSEFINEVADSLAPYWPLNAEKLRGLALKNWMVTLFGDRFEQLIAAFEKAKEVHEKEVAASSDDWFNRMSSFRLPGVPTDGTDNKPKAESDGSGRDS
jgi:predicted transcriptional regulator